MELLCGSFDFEIKIIFFLAESVDKWFFYLEYIIIKLIFIHDCPCTHHHGHTRKDLTFEWLSVSVSYVMNVVQVGMGRQGFFCRNTLTLCWAFETLDYFILWTLFQKDA